MCRALGYNVYVGWTLSAQRQGEDDEDDDEDDDEKRLCRTLRSSPPPTPPVEQSGVERRGAAILGACRELWARTRQGGSREKRRTAEEEGEQRRDR